MVTTGRHVDGERLRVAEEAADALRKALRQAGVTLPSLRVDLVSYAGRAADPPLVELGRCTPDTARRLADALRTAGARGEPPPRGRERAPGRSRGHDHDFGRRLP
ncbi:MULTISPECIES: hypothetical protein [Streptomyces]|uniref:Uncharacterized protein n=1 Tax=Streptomyces desertarenae TaxID=2666184 RepID=A0ABW4PEI2_9ACTN